MHTGIFGGSFDPIHMGHLILAETVRSDLGLGRILFLPAARPPHKPNEPLTSPEDRLAMLRLAIADHPAFLISDLELRPGGPCFTADTLSALGRESPYRGDAFYLLVGSDNLIQIHTWRDPERLFAEATLVGLRRPGFDSDRIREPYRSRIRMVDAPLLSISGTEIRARVRMGRSIRYWVPHAVEAYIAEKGLYRS